MIVSSEVIIINSWFSLAKNSARKFIFANDVGGMSIEAKFTWQSLFYNIELLSFLFARPWRKFDKSLDRNRLQEVKVAILKMWFLVDSTREQSSEQNYCKVINSSEGFMLMISLCLSICVRFFAYKYNPKLMDVS